MLIGLFALASAFAGGGKEQGGATGAAGDKVTLSFMHLWLPESKEGNAIAFLAAIKRFQQKYPNVTLDQQVLPHDSYLTKIKTQAAANALGDVFVANGSMIQEFVANKGVLALDSILSDDQAWKNSFLPGIFDEFIVEGKVYGVPVQSFSTSVIYYNSKMFADAGITSFPKTWSEFKQAIGKLKQKGYTPIALGNKAQWVVESCIFSTLANRFTGVKWFYDLKAGKGPKFTDKEFVQSLAAIKELVDVGAFNSDLNSLDNNQQQQLYGNGKSAMFIEGAWAVSTLLANATTEVIDATKLAIIPAVGGKGEDNIVSGGSGWSHALGTKMSPAQLKAAVALMKELNSQQTAVDQIENNAQPAIKVAKYDKAKLAPMSNEYFELVSKTKFGPIYDIQLKPSLVDVLYRGLQDILSGAASPEALAAKLQKELESAE
jgi:raffinose/stachyose/melibiose transport system substrate-binding protein